MFLPYIYVIKTPDGLVTVLWLYTRRPAAGHSASLVKPVFVYSDASFAGDVSNRFRFPVPVVALVKVTAGVATVAVTISETTDSRAVPFIFFPVDATAVHHLSPSPSYCAESEG